VKSKATCSAFTITSLMVLGLGGFSKSNQSSAVPATKTDAKPLYCALPAFTWTEATRAMDIV
jgi:hypothetical protein